MIEPSRFGEFTLLRQLASDALGERYRAAATGTAGSARDVRLLQLFTGRGIEGKALAARARALPAKLQPLMAPSVARRIGEVGGLPYAVYDDCQAFSLGALMEKANGGFSSLSSEHAALIVERMAKGLIALHQAGVVHGFLVPHLVLVSAEGVVLLLGCEHGLALAARWATGRMDPSFAPYLAPEVRAGEAPQPADDLFSLGALFFQLLTGAPPRVDQPLEAQLAAATQMATGSPLPKALFALLCRSLTARAGRMVDAGAWHGELSAWLHASAERLTNFDLAFLVVELFREDIENDEGENASAPVAPPAAAPRAPAPAAPPASAEPAPAMVAAAFVPTEASYEAMPETPVASAARAVGSVRPGGGRGRWIALAAVVAVAVSVVGVWRWSASAPISPPAAVAAPPPPVVEPAPPPPALDLEAAEAELERLMRERTSKLGKQLAADYDVQVGDLEAQIAASRAEAAAGAAAPVVVSVPTAEYPEAARASGRSAVVTVRVLVGADGTVQKTELAPGGGAGAGFDPAALAAARGARFTPLADGGASAARWTELVIRFTPPAETSRPAG